MKRKLVLLGVVLVLVVGLAVPLVAQAASVWRWSGESAWAEFNAVDGDVYTSVYIDAGEGKYVSPPKNGEAFSYVYVWLSRYDAATDTHDGAWGYAELAPRELVIAKTLNTAALSATVPMQEWDGDEYDLGVEIDWAALGRPLRDHAVFHYVYPKYYNDSYSYTGLWATADADGVFTYMGDTVWEGAADSASLSSSKSRSTSVSHYVYP